MATRTFIPTATKHDSTGKPAPGCVELVFTDVVLAGNGTFTSAFVPTDGFNYLALAYTANVSGTASIEFSQDGTTVLYSQAISAGVTGAVQANVYGLYARVKFVNGATIQTSFVLALNGKTA